MKDTNPSQLSLLDIARLAMFSHGLDPDFSSLVQDELEHINNCATEKLESLPDLTRLLWCSIDNDDSMDLDQITFAEKTSQDSAKIYVAIADVDALVKSGSAIDQHAQKNTTSVYTGVTIFPMLPEKLSTNLSSLSEGEDRIAIIIEMHINKNGDVEKSQIYRAHVRNHAKLAYNSVAEWLEGKGPLPSAANRIPGLEEQLRLQDRFAQKMKSLRYKNGALDLETIEPRAVMKDGIVTDMSHELKNRARELIEDFMIAANGVVARFLAKEGYPTLRRIVRSPERWDKIMQIADGYGEKLPAQPNSKALNEFLSRRKKADALSFPDLSLTIIKLLGRGEYVLQMPGTSSLGHFGLSVRDYSHSTAPNRRFPDIITQRLIKSALRKEEAPYTHGQLSFLAKHCTEQENAAEKVERHVRKSAAASLMSSRIGDYFNAIVTGASEKGTWARILQPPIEGKIVHGENGLDVGDRVRLKLIGVDIERGFINFVRAH